MGKRRIIHGNDNIFWKLRINVHIRCMTQIMSCIGCYLIFVAFFYQPEKPQRPASFTDEDFPVDSILSQMLKEDKSEQEKENGECPYNLVVAYDWMGRMEHNRKRHESLCTLFLYLVFFVFFFFFNCHN